MQELFGHCKDFHFYTERNGELSKSNPKRNGGEGVFEVLIRE